MSDNFTYLALGSNLGDKKANFETAIKKLEENGVRFVDASPLYKTPALLLKGSPYEWNIPYLNCVIKVDTDISPMDLLGVCKKIESEMGRDFSEKWSPRPIDIDILLYKDVKIDTELLTIPHKAIFDRYFLLDELSFLHPEIVKNYYGTEHQPVFMGVLNITPDSFSDGGKYNDKESFAKTFNLWEQENVSIIDIGAESTRPNAELLTAEQELQRLQFVFEFLRNKKFGYFKPKLSIDTYHYDTAKKAVENGFDIINDVNALKDERMLDLLKENASVNYVLMHSLSVPPRKDLTVQKPVEELQKFLEEKLNIFEKNNISKHRVIFDLGIGFGKSPAQSFELLQNVEKFQKYGVKILVGHSRKGFLKMLGNNTPDYETLAISLKLSNKVDILRVHTPIEHQNSLLAYGMMNNQIVL